MFEEGSSDHCRHRRLAGTLISAKLGLTIMTPRNAKKAAEEQDDCFMISPLAQSGTCV